MIDYVPLKFIGELPDGYEYKLMAQGNTIKVIGVALDKEPILFVLENDVLRKVEL